MVGIGRIGLPTALMFARSGFKTVGVDIDENLVARLSSGDFSLKDEPGLEDVFRQVVDDGTVQGDYKPRRRCLMFGYHSVVPAYTNNR